MIDQLSEILNEGNVNKASVEEYSSRVDALYSKHVSYLTIKREKAEHRLMLWHRLKGRTTQEIATLMNYSYKYVREICKQSWFLEAFCRLSTEMGKDKVETFLEGELIPALQRTIDLAHSADSDAVKLAANREILDRFLGKSVVKAEVKQAGTIDHVVHDAAALLEEQRKLDLQLHASGLSLAGRS